MPNILGNGKLFYGIKLHVYRYLIINDFYVTPFSLQNIFNFDYLTIFCLHCF